jgi:hypothetical protein
MGDVLLGLGHNCGVGMEWNGMDGALEEFLGTVSTNWVGTI